MNLPNPLLKVPEEERTQLLELIEETKSQFYFTDAHMKVFFNAWNEHINPFSKENIGCTACRSKVVSKLRFYYGQYKTSLSK